MPADIIGASVLNMATSQFTLHKGPVFTDLLLVDEINRMPPRTQAALLEAMEERQVTIDGSRHQLSPAFTTFATQNPIEFEGTYPLPEAELDRFFVKIRVGYPDARGGRRGDDSASATTRASTHGTSTDRSRAALPGGLAEARREVAAVRVEPALFGYIAGDRQAHARLAGGHAWRQPPRRDQPDAARQGNGRDPTAATSCCRTM